MTVPHTARAGDPRALVGAAALGSLAGLAIAGAYLTGGLARQAVSHARIEALAAKAGGSFSEQALTLAAGDAGALAIAKRLEGAGPSEQDLADRRMARLALQVGEPPAAAAAKPAVAAAPSTAPAAPLFRVSNAVAQPFRIRGALDESRDLECLTQAVYYEARGESAEGQKAVAQVVLNRVRHPAFPKTVCGVVFQHVAGGCQFSFACDGSTKRHLENAAWRRAEKVAAAALDGQVAAAVGNATHFHVASLGQVWSTGMLKVAQVGSHVFYRFGGARGAPKMFHAEPQPSLPLSPDKVSQPPRVVMAGLSPAGVITASTAVVERAAAAVESIAKPAPKAEPAKTDAKAEAPAKPADAAPAAATTP